MAGLLCLGTVSGSALASVGSHRTVPAAASPSQARMLVTIKTVHVKPSKLTVTVTGLKRHTTYEVAATATNSIGAGPASSRKQAKTR